MNFEIRITVFDNAVSPLSFRLSEIISVSIATPTILIRRDICNESISKYDNSINDVSTNSIIYSIINIIITIITVSLNKKTNSGLYVFITEDNIMYTKVKIAILINMFIN
jgi:hypothetical protein